MNDREFRLALLPETDPDLPYWPYTSRDDALRRETVDYWIADGWPVEAAEKAAQERRETYEAKGWHKPVVPDAEAEFFDD